jgi:hypothetical protein
MNRAKLNLVTLEELAHAMGIEVVRIFYVAVHYDFLGWLSEL